MMKVIRFSLAAAVSFGMWIIILNNPVLFIPIGMGLAIIFHDIREINKNS